MNCSRVEEEQNMMAYQFHRGIFYRVYKDVEPGTEFLVWYGIFILMLYTPSGDNFSEKNSEKSWNTSTNTLKKKRKK